MYQYDNLDKKFVNERLEQYRNQLSRKLAGTISEDEFRSLRLMNGLYLQRHAYMLRVAIPYGILSANQLRVLADIAERYDQGWGHFTTRQNIQFNWIRLEDTADILAKLAEVNMHAIQTSGNCVRNITTDALVGVAADEVVDTRPYCEWLRQYSSLHPEFSYLPRKFKIAINGAKNDRTVLQAHDIGINLHLDESQQIVADIWVGGGMGRTPLLGECVRANLAWAKLPDYLSANLRVYNRHGRRDNAFKARIKILVKAIGIEEYRQQVEEEYLVISQDKNKLHQASPEEWARINQHFAKREYPAVDVVDKQTLIKLFVKENSQEKKEFTRWLKTNVAAHRVDGYGNIYLSLKPQNKPPGDITAKQMRAVADLALQYSIGEIRVTHEQNLVLTDVAQTNWGALWQELRQLGFATSNIGLITDIISCPGGDFCSLANARSLSIAERLQEVFADLDYVHDVGEVSINISGCINSCGHHHVANIGILGVDKENEEFYQITLGGAQGNNTKIGKVVGAAFSAEDTPKIVAKIIKVYLQNRIEEEALCETFSTTFSRIGIKPFKEALYG